MTPRKGIAVVVLTTVLALLVVCAVWDGNRTGDAFRDCQQRGGHLEPVIGGRGGAVCLGGTP